MTWLADHWLDVLGWGGSALLVYSLLQASVLRLRVLNAIACVILIVFNAALEVWPMVGMNTVLVAINVWFIVRLLRDRHDETAFEVLEVGSADEYLRHTLRVHGADILKVQPDVRPRPRRHRPGRVPGPEGRRDRRRGAPAQNGDTADVLLDYVTPRYRDFSPGEFVWRRSGLLADRGVRRVVTPPGMVGAYYDRLGFRRTGDT